MALIAILLAISLFLGLIIWLLIRLFVWLQRPDDLAPESLHTLLPFLAHSRWTTVDGVRLHYVEQGHGPAVVLIHGYCASSYSWREVIGPLSQSYRVVALDLKGFGLSDKTAGDYRTESQAELVAHFLQALNLGPAVLVGNSMGGSISLAVALHHPKLVQALALVGSAAFTLNQRLNMTRRLVSLPFVGEVVGAGLLMNSRLLVRWFLHRCYYDPSRINPAQRAVYHAPLGTRLGGAAAQHAGLEFDPGSVVQSLDRIKHSILLIWGEADRIIPIENAYRLRNRLPNARLVILPRSGHVPQEETPDLFLDALRPFLQEVTAQSRSMPTPRSG